MSNQNEQSGGSILMIIVVAVVVAVFSQMRRSKPASPSRPNTAVNSTYNHGGGGNYPPGTPTLGQ